VGNQLLSNLKKYNIKKVKYIDKIENLKFKLFKDKFKNNGNFRKTIKIRERSKSVWI
jgi:hypothetical protein